VNVGSSQLHTIEQTVDTIEEIADIPGQTRLNTPNPQVNVLHQEPGRNNDKSQVRRKHMVDPQSARRAAWKAPITGPTTQCQIRHRKRGGLNASGFRASPSLAFGWLTLRHILRNRQLQASAGASDPGRCAKSRRAVGSPCAGSLNRGTHFDVTAFGNSKSRPQRSGPEKQRLQRPRR
jgi:hypothetical protein